MKRYLPMLALSPVLVWGPTGGVDVKPTPDGYEVDDFRGGVTTIMRTQNGYIVLPPKGPAEFVDMEGYNSQKQERNPTNENTFDSE